MSTDEAARSSRSSWREQAVARRLDPARARAEDRVQRFLDAALALMNDSSSGIDFTVQEVVERSGQSLRSFYQYFGGKQELLLALFEETVLLAADRLRQRASTERNALEQLRWLIVEYSAICRSGGSKHDLGRGPTPAMAKFARQLLTAHPEEAALAFEPLIELFEEVLDKAAAEGSIRVEMSHRRLAGTLLELIMFNIFSRPASSSSDKSDERRGEELYLLIVQGIAAR